MCEYIIRTKNLSKKIGNDYVLKDVNMNIKKGDIYGLIGKNGAGKTTLMRVLTGLTSIDKGEIEIFEKSKNKVKERKRVGVLIEKPIYFEEMDIYNNLEYLRVFKGIPGKECIEEKLELVGLSNLKGKKIKDYSLGMKQKVGLAIALLNDPEILILDEPTNGLDPVGIVMMRELIKKLNKESGVTILISSHILSELSKISKSIGVMKEGRLVKEISMEELIEISRVSLDIQVDNVEKCSWILETMLNINDYKVVNNNTIKIYEGIDNPKTIVKELSKEEVYISQMITKGESLEDYVMNIVGD